MDILHIATKQIYDQSSILICYLIAFIYNSLFQKPLLLFKSFTGLTIQEFDYIYIMKDIQIYEDYEIQHLSPIKRKVVIERKFSAEGRRFKMNVKDRF